MKLDTLRYGTIHIEPDDIWTFPEGLLGFPNCTEFTFINEEDTAPFRILQSLDSPSLAFVLIDPLIVNPTYHFKLTLDDIKVIKTSKVDNVSVYCIVSLSESLKDATINLQGPLVVNNKAKMGHQFVLFEDDYSVNEKLIKEDVIKSQKEDDKVVGLD
ncbi:MAG: flagellar assembly protein FliW [SAR324 cluster bacterium]|nr:flagellar assembly protein FliW [SAR324 cluster bacterium]